ncbi:MAG TPA: LysR family transcriptional regulator [Polyangia bacterium]|nr:LysR family transcriptional regulator [Polyangia bacterium]
MIDWNDLRYFLAIARAGTLAGAARDLGVEHSTVGRRLGAIESALGARLLTRTPDGFSLTEAGRAVQPLAERIAADVEAIERRVSGQDARVEGTVRITTSEALSGYFVRQLASLTERHPGLTVEILSGNRAFDLMRGEADIAVRIREVMEPDLVVRKLATAGWSMYATPAYVARKGAPPSPEDLRGHDIVAYDATMAAVPGAQWLAEHGEGTTVAMRGNSIIAAMNAAILGLGLTVLPCFIGDGESALRRLTARLLGARDIFLVVHPDLARVARVRAVMDFIVETFERDAVKWAGQPAPPAAGMPS